MSIASPFTELEINVQVRAAAQELITASLKGDVEKVIAMYRSDAPFLEQGRLTDRFSDLATSIREFFATHRVTETTLHDVRVIAVGPSAAVLTARYSFSATSNNGMNMANVGAWSAVFVHDGVDWRIIAPHQSVSSPLAHKG
ncbi:MAG: nuclear transport factor 2 family protein [Acidobacteriota bacterium]